LILSDAILQRNRFSHINPYRLQMEEAAAASVAKRLAANGILSVRPGATAVPDLHIAMYLTDLDDCVSSSSTPNILLNKKDPRHRFKNASHAFKFARFLDPTRGSISFRAQCVHATTGTCPYCTKCTVDRCNTLWH
jgi:hypothetical protein